MKPKLLEMKVRRHEHTATNDEKIFTTSGRSCLAPATGGARPNRSPWLLTERTEKTVLLVSDDSNLGVRVSDTADLAELAFQQVNDARNAFRLAARDRPAVVLLDLDLPASAGWHATEQFLKDDHGPPLALMTGCTGHFDLDMAMCTGMVLDKSIVQRHLLEHVYALLTKSDMEQKHYRDCQRLLVRWLRPYEWAAPALPDHRHWGINE